VIGYYSTEMKAKIKENILEAGKTVAADYIITGSLSHTGQGIQAQITLLVTATGEMLLCRFFQKNFISTEFFEIRDLMVQDIFCFVGDCYGTMLQEWRKRFNLKMYQPALSGYTESFRKK